MGIFLHYANDHLCIVTMHIGIKSTSHEQINQTISILNEELFFKPHPAS